jgi:hypothetical protein
MEEKKSYTLQEAEQYFAKALNGEVWALLGKADRTASDDERMLYAAYASCYHWLQAGTGTHQERGEWLIAHVCTVLGLKDEALRHASRCLELTQQHPDLMKDFDVAYGFEAMARANALAGNRDAALKYYRLADEAGKVIADAEDKSIFLGDFNGGNWYGVK